MRGEAARCVALRLTPATSSEPGGARALTHAAPSLAPAAQRLARAAARPSAARRALAAGPRAENRNERPLQMRSRAIISRWSSLEPSPSSKTLQSR